MDTLSQIVQGTVGLLSLVPGVSVQKYAEDRIAQFVQITFDMLFDEMFWPQFEFRQLATLDGSLGVVTTDLSSVLKRFVDIKSVFHNANPVSLKRMPDSMNPFKASGFSRYIAPYNDPTKVFQVIPPSAVGPVYIMGRTKPSNFVMDSVINFDATTLKLGATYQYLEDDATNPGATQKYQTLFNNRIKQLAKLLDQHGVPLSPDGGAYPSEWYTR
jgi:hypothetical protein